MEKLFLSLLAFFNLAGGDKAQDLPDDIPHIQPGIEMPAEDTTTHTTPEQTKALKTDDEASVDTQSKTENKDGEKKAQNIAFEFIQNQPEFTQLEGSHLTLVNALEAKCEGCWVIDTKFYLLSPKNQKTKDIFTAKITLNNWEVVESVFGSNGHVYESSRKCQQDKGRVDAKHTCKEYELPIGDVFLPNGDIATCCGPNAQVPSPADQYCAENGGFLFGRTVDKIETQYCIFDSGQECEKWEFFRGLCTPEATKKYTLEDPKKCAVVKIKCDEGQTFFSDQKGCGCQKTIPCSTTYEPVCGETKDKKKKSFGNVCLAAQSGIKKIEKGECPAEPKSFSDEEITQIEEHLLRDYFEDGDEIVARVLDGTDTHIKGSVRKKDKNRGKLFLAVLNNDVWEVVFYGSKNPECDEIAPYKFPPRFVSHCPLQLTSQTLSEQEEKNKTETNSEEKNESTDTQEEQKSPQNENKQESEKKYIDEPQESVHEEPTVEKQENREETDTQNEEQEKITKETKDRIDESKTEEEEEAKQTDTQKKEEKDKKTENEEPAVSLQELINILAKKRNTTIEKLKVQIEKATETHIEGKIQNKEVSEYLFARTIENIWEIVYTGAQKPACTTLTDAKFPDVMMENCLDKEALSKQDTEKIETDALSKNEPSETTEKSSDDRAKKTTNDKPEEKTKNNDTSFEVKTDIEKKETPKNKNLEVELEDIQLLQELKEKIEKNNVLTDEEFEKVKELLSTYEHLLDTEEKE